MGANVKDVEYGEDAKGGTVREPGGDAVVSYVCQMYDIL